ncbi:YbdD/YjiX family protein [Agromyces archimandritae]|uniref:YbdD/YjiX family protein n=2 Tax=Agromyces archimandritae TaxID=2781962 RepID=A0A975IQ14_9MICO|nr:YbdD/YjiX family protein [Agromyces archimandritae]
MPGSAPSPIGAEPAAPHTPGTSHPAGEADPGLGGTARFGERLRRAGSGIRWYVTNLMGDTAYRTYLEHHTRHHPGEPPLTEREFWREKMDEQDRNPGARCC